MNVDTEALNTIRTIRARIDPIPVYAPGGTVVDSEEQVAQHVIEDRLEAISGLSNTEPRRIAEWSETAQHLQESSMRNSIFTQDFRLAASTVFVFEKFASDRDISVPTLPLSWEAITTASDEELEALLADYELTVDEFDKEMIHDMVKRIRHGIARTQNQLFVTSIYDELPEELTNGVPKAFWKRPDPVLGETGTEGEAEQVDMSDF